MTSHDQILHYYTILHVVLAYPCMILHALAECQHASASPMLRSQRGLSRVHTSLHQFDPAAAAQIAWKVGNSNLAAKSLEKA